MNEIPSLDEKQSTEIKDRIKSIAISSTTHGLSKVFRSRRQTLKVVWLIFLLLSASFCFYLISKSVYHYFDYPVTTKISSVNVKEADFPTVAICASFMTEYSIDLIIDLLEVKTNYSYYSSSEGNLTKLEYLNNLLFTDPSLRSVILYNMYQLNETNKKLLSIPLSDMIITCSFETNSCNHTDFDWFYDYDFGNCFVINSVAKSFGNLKTKSSGRSNALTLEIFGGFEQLIPSFEHSHGLNIMIYSKNEDPNYSDNFKTISAKYGIETMIAVNRLFIKKLPKPYSTCDFNFENANIDSFDSELYKTIVKTNKTYRRSNCFILCYEKVSLEKCGCNAISDRKCLSPTQIGCAENVYFIDYKQNSFNGDCDGYCPLECDSLTYQLSEFYKSFPNIFYAKFLLNTIDSFRYPLGMNRSMNVDDLRNNIARLIIYYEDIDYQLIQEIPTVSVINLIANIGGMLGLFMGMSCLSFIEFLEMAFEIFWHFTKKMNSKIDSTI